MYLSPNPLSNPWPVFCVFYPSPKSIQLAFVLNERIPRVLPSGHAAVEIPDIRIAQFDQCIRGNPTHMPRAAIEHNFRTFISRKLREIRLDVGVGKKEICLGKLAHIRNMYIHEGKNLWPPAFV